MQDICDAHVHLYQADARWAGTQPAVAGADLEAYRRQQALVGSRRVVVVQPLLYGDENAYTLGQVQALGLDRARAVVIAPAEVDDARLSSWQRQGVAGLRFFVGSAHHAPEDAGRTLATLRALAPRLRAHGLHLQVNTNGRFLEREPGAFRDFDCPLVLDHLGHVLPTDGEGDRFVGLDALSRLMESGRTWVKVSGLYLDSRLQARGCIDMRAAVQALAARFPERLVWGTNWPHPTVKAGQPIPDDAGLLARVREWLPDARLQALVLRDNAARLYGFA